MNDDLLNEFLLEVSPNPERKGCPDEQTLKALAEDRLPPGHAALQHVASCSECYAEFRHYRQDWKDSRGSRGTTAEPVLLRPPGRSKYVPWALAAGLALAIGAGVLSFRQHHAPAPAGALVASSSPMVVNASVDLFNAVTVRGSGDDEPTPMQEVSLPSAVVRLSVILPRLSESGPYEIVVARDRSGRDIVAHGHGVASDSGGKVRVEATLDLRNASPGMYFLATVRGSDNGTYYYPLKVR